MVKSGCIGMIGGGGTLICSKFNAVRDAGSVVWII